MSRSDASHSLLALPKGGGAMRGIGEKFAPDLYAGTGNFTVPLTVPPGRNGFQPDLSLVYSTGNGNGWFGLGWALGIPGIARKTSQGIPRYEDAVPQAAERDTFILSGAEDLVPLGSVRDEAGQVAERYRARTEGLFAEILHYRDAARAIDYWRVRSKDGTVSYYGTNPAVGEYPGGQPLAPAGDRAATTAPQAPRRVFDWKLTLTKDPFGNRIEYLYEVDTGNNGPHRWNRPRLRQLRYADYGDPANPNFLVAVTFDYEDRPDPFSDYRAGFEIRTARRCKAILVETRADRVRPVRRYELRYGTDPDAAHSVLEAIEVVSFDDAGTEVRDLPPLELAYTRFDPKGAGGRRLVPVQGADLPPTSLANPQLELVDLSSSAPSRAIGAISATAVSIYRNRCRMHRLAWRSPIPASCSLTRTVTAEGTYW
jgi:hypothetical protein